MIFKLLVPVPLDFFYAWLLVITLKYFKVIVLLHVPAGRSISKYFEVPSGTRVVSAEATKHLAAAATPPTKNF